MARMRFVHQPVEITGDAQFPPGKAVQVSVYNAYDPNTTDPKPIFQFMVDEGGTWSEGNFGVPFTAIGQPHEMWLDF